MDTFYGLWNPDSGRYRFASEVPPQSEGWPPEPVFLTGYSGELPDNYSPWVMALHVSQERLVEGPIPGTVPPIYLEYAGDDIVLTYGAAWVDEGIERETVQVTLSFPDGLWPPQMVAFESDQDTLSSLYRPSSDSKGTSLAGTVAFEKTGSVSPTKLPRFPPEIEMPRSVATVLEDASDDEVVAAFMAAHPDWRVGYYQYSTLPGNEDTNRSWFVMIFEGCDTLRFHLRYTLDLLPQVSNHEPGADCSTAPVVPTDHELVLPDPEETYRIAKREGFVTDQPADITFQWPTPADMIYHDGQASGDLVWDMAFRTTDEVNGQPVFLEYHATSTPPGVSYSGLAIDYRG